jgi:hypothetical protein
LTGKLRVDVDHRALMNIPPLRVQSTIHTKLLRERERERNIEILFRGQSVNRMLTLAALYYALKLLVALLLAGRYKSKDFLYWQKKKRKTEMTVELCQHE